MQTPKLATTVFLTVVVFAPMMAAACGARGGTAVSRSIDDATISTRVKTALLNEPGITVTKVDVQTSQGVVTLTGSVKSKEEEAHVIATARKIEGVRDVKSALQIQP